MQELTICLCVKNLVESHILRCETQATDLQCERTSVLLGTLYTSTTACTLNMFIYTNSKVKNSFSAFVTCYILNSCILTYLTGPDYFHENLVTSEGLSLHSRNSLSAVQCSSISYLTSHCCDVK